MNHASGEIPSTEDLHRFKILPMTTCSLWKKRDEVNFHRRHCSYRDVETPAVSSSSRGGCTPDALQQFLRYLRFRPDPNGSTSVPAEFRLFQLPMLLSSG